MKITEMNVRLPPSSLTLLSGLIHGPGDSSGKALSYRLEGHGFDPGDGRVEISLHSFVSRMALTPTQPPIK